MSEDNSLESLGINVPKPLSTLTVKSGRKFMRLGTSTLYLSASYELLSFMNHISTVVVFRIAQKVESPHDEVLLVGDNITWDASNKLFRSPKSIYPVFHHPASPLEVVDALKEDEVFIKISNILDSVYGIQVNPNLLESGLLSLDCPLSSVENVRAQKLAIKL